ncbi:MAG: Re/Si-specific NAD(P)(+) transhydrogenase subunit alpha [Planctomycetes bacterium]|nr:Re/Si-specific NAD(P)(+) transhydrogenase subunit alpha [Planctomycetota bacterium]
MRVGVPRETAAGERRVALVPELVAKLRKVSLDVDVQAGAGESAGFSDALYTTAGASIVPDAAANADIILKVQPPNAAEIDALKQGALVIGLLQPATNFAGLEALAKHGVTAFAMERMPRITRAQAMDALSAMSTVSGYKAVLLAANHLPRFFPLLMTAAGTITAARVCIVGAGVAGLQAIGTAKRLGAIVEAYDTRPAVREQVESLGGKFIDLGLEAESPEAKTGYATAQSEDFYHRQRAALAKWLSAADVVITTALVPGRKAPLLVTEEAVHGMKPGSVIVDLAAEQGGNCALCKPGEDAVENGVTILGPLNLPSALPFHASQMYARTVVSYLLHLWRDGAIQLDLADELTRGPLVTHQGKNLVEGSPA